MKRTSSATSSRPSSTYPSAEGIGQDEGLLAEKELILFPVDAERLQSIGIIVNEILTNSMKHAFKDRDGGRIMVSAKASGRRIEISVQDNGVGMPEDADFENSGGFGLQLVGALLAKLDGKILIERSNGTKVILVFEA
jgi:two-component sensor histidine kinase